MGFCIFLSENGKLPCQSLGGRYFTYKHILQAIITPVDMQRETIDGMEVFIVVVFIHKAVANFTWIIVDTFWCILMLRHVLFEHENIWSNIFFGNFGFFAILWKIPYLNFRIALCLVMWDLIFFFYLVSQRSFPK